MSNRNGHRLGASRASFLRPPVLDTINEPLPQIPLEKKQSVKDLVILFEPKREKIKEIQEIQEKDTTEVKKAFQFSRYKKVK
jgi:hypothetical protein